MERQYNGIEELGKGFLKLKSVAGGEKKEVRCAGDTVVLVVVGFQHKGQWTSAPWNVCVCGAENLGVCEWEEEESGKNGRNRTD